MSDLLDLIRASKSDPYDDAPRLVLADWLEEHGDEYRAAFVRQQIVRPDSDDDGLLPRPEWYGEWKALGDGWRNRDDRGGGWSCCFRRGFIRVSDLYHELYDRLPDLLEPTFDWSWVEGINFGSWHDGDWSLLFQSPKLLELNRLEFIDDNYHSNLVQPLCASPYLTNLKYLRLVCLDAADEGIRQISQVSALGRLESLELIWTNLARRGARAFTRSEVWDGLRACSFRDNHCGDSALTELAEGRRRPRLECLDIGMGRYTDRGLLALARSDCFPALKELRIGYSTLEEDPVTFGPFGIESILDSPHGRPEQLTISIVSREPVPKDIEALARTYPDRIALNWHNPNPPDGSPSRMSAAIHALNCPKWKMQ